MTNPAIWGMMGTVVGALVVFSANIITVRMQARTDESRINRERAEQFRRERKTAYLRLLGVTRRMRYLSRPGRDRTTPVVDELGNELSLVSYEVELIAPPDVVAASDRLAQATRTYLRLAQEWDRTPEPDGGDSHSLAALEAQRATTRSLVDEFVSAARADLT